MSLVQRSSLVQRWARMFASRTFAAGVLSLAVLGAGVVGTGCKHETSSSSGTQDQYTGTLYDRLGREQGIGKVVDSFVGYAAPDERVNFTRKGEPHEWKATPENVNKLKLHLVQFIVSNTGGPQTYTGQDMATVHKGMNITQSQWDAAVDDFGKALNDNKVPAAEQGELVKIVLSTHDSIVGK